MGRYRSDSSGSEYSRKSKKKKKQRSRSSSSSEHSHVSDSKRRKHRKKHKSSTSLSKSADKRHGHGSRSSRRSRSTSLERYRSDSRSSDRRSSRRSRSPASRPDRSKSPPPRCGRSRSRSSSARRRSYSSRHKFRSSSRERRRKSRSDSEERRSDSTESKPQRPAVSDPVPGFSEMFQTPAERAEERTRQAFRAAAAAGDKLKGMTSVEMTGPSVLSDSRNFAVSVTAIESDSFVASSFLSTRLNKIKEEATESSVTHDDAIFGSLALSGFTMTPDPDTKPMELDPDSIIHPSLYCDPQEKMERWMSRLAQLRRRKLEGESIQLTVG